MFPPMHHFVLIYLVHSPFWVRFLHKWCTSCGSPILVWAMSPHIPLHSRVPEMAGYGANLSSLCFWSTREGIDSIKMVQNLALPDPEVNQSCNRSGSWSRSRSLGQMWMSRRQWHKVLSRRPAWGPQSGEKSKRLHNPSVTLSLRPNG